MDKQRAGVEKRSKEDRRKGRASPHNGPERRSLKYQRSDTDRRRKKDDPKGGISKSCSIFSIKSDYCKVYKEYSLQFW